MLLLLICVLEGREVNAALAVPDGAGASLPVTHSLEVSGLFVATAKGSNGAHRQRTLVLSVNISFGSGLRGLGGATDAAGPASDAGRVTKPSR